MFAPFCIDQRFRLTLAQNFAAEAGQRAKRQPRINRRIGQLVSETTAAIIRARDEFLAGRPQYQNPATVSVSLFADARTELRGELLTSFAVWLRTNPTANWISVKAYNGACIKMCEKYVCARAVECRVCVWLCGCVSMQKSLRLFRVLGT